MSFLMSRLSAPLPGVLAHETVPELETNTTAFLPLLRGMTLASLVFAALAMFLLSKGGDVDISGEKHGVEVGPAASEVASSPK